ncbi:MAG TPA: SDR family NAD(P)-dependent oxidoreductase [Actinomycetota bacterium]|nr:SDR family NAD(P)-dependent oxidoreductase [Actinomycetota bacterium]
MKPLDGKVVLVTGAARGIGRAISAEFLTRGARLVLTDIDEAALLQTADELRTTEDSVLAFSADVTSEVQVNEMIHRSISEAGALDVLVLNAGVSVSGPAEVVPIEDWRWITDINMWSHVYAVRAALPYFKERNSGHLVHVSSAAGIFGTPAAAAYCMTKFAVFGLAESLATSLNGTGIGVSVVCPQFVDTDIGLRARVTTAPDSPVGAEDIKQVSRQMMKDSGLPPEKVAQAVVEGVEEDRFLILPHPEILKFAQIKWADPERYIGKASEALKAQGKLFGE